MPSCLTAPLSIGDQIMAGRLQDKVVIVTGAARGIGAAIARLFAQEGAYLGLIDIDQAALQPLFLELAAAGTDTIGATADIARRDEVEAAGPAVLKHFGRVECPINNSGIKCFAQSLPMRYDARPRSHGVQLSA